MTNNSVTNTNRRTKQPFVSLVIPTFNSDRSLRSCLRSIREQHYPPEKLEIIIADAGSTDRTLHIAREFSVNTIVRNELQTGEAGKSAGIRAASGYFIALVDSDNILEGPDWLKKMIEPFQDPQITATEPLFFTRRNEDPALTRYFAMLGMNDPLCLFLGNYDRQSLITGRWTGLDVTAEDHESWLKLTLDAERIPTIGANGFIIRRSLLDRVTWEPYFFDIDIMHQLVAAGHPHMAKVKCGIVHLYCRTFAEFARKQDRRVKDFLYFSENKGRTYPWRRFRRTGIAKFCIYTVLTLPLLAQMLRGAARKKDLAWFCHIPACWITLRTYGTAVLRKAVGLSPKPKPRDEWQK